MIKINCFLFRQVNQDFIDDIIKEIQWLIKKKKNQWPWTWAGAVFQLFQGLYPFLSSIFSTSSNGSPLVSGTMKKMRKNARADIQQNNRNVAAEPRASVKLRNVCATIRLETQFATAAIPPQMPLNLRGYISELIIQGTVPMPGEYEIMYAARAIRASHPKLLGHPRVYHSRWFALHVSFTMSFTNKHEPGRSCQWIDQYMLIMHTKRIKRNNRCKGTYFIACMSTETTIRGSFQAFHTAPFHAGSWMKIRTGTVSGKARLCCTDRRRMCCSSEEYTAQ